MVLSFKSLVPSIGVCFLSVLISPWIHEAGHVLACLMVDAQIAEIQINANPVVFSKTIPSTSVQFELGAIPNGSGHVLADVSNASPLEQSFVSLAGPGATLFLALLLLAPGWSKERTNKGVRFILAASLLLATFTNASPVQWDVEPPGSSPITSDGERVAEIVAANVEHGSFLITVWGFGSAAGGVGSLVLLGNGLELMPRSKNEETR